MSQSVDENTREDGALVNVLSGLGVPSRDKAVATTISLRHLLTEEQLETLYLAGLPRRYVDAIADDMLRHQVTIKLGEDADDTSRNTIRDFERYLRDTQFHYALSEVVKLQRLYGGAGLVLLIDDGLDPSEPVDPERIRAIEGFVPLSRRELLPEDVTITDYSKPERYRISTSQKITADQTEPTLDLLIHNTRVARFDGLYLPWRQRSRNQGWGMSCLQILWDAYKRYETAMGGLETMVTDSDLFVHKIPGLFQRLAAGQEADIRKRLEANALSRSLYGGMVVDREEEVEFLARALANIAQATDPFAREMQAATGWPASILMGDSPGGLGKEGRFEERVWASLVEQWQECYCRTPITEVFTLIFASQEGPTGGQLPDDWSVEFPSVFTETDTEKTALRLQQAQIDQVYAGLQALNPLEIRMARFGGTEFSLETPLNEIITERMAEQQDAQHEAQLVATATQEQTQVEQANQAEISTQQAALGVEQTAQQVANPPEAAPARPASKKPQPKTKRDSDDPEIVYYTPELPLRVINSARGFYFGVPAHATSRSDALVAAGIVVGPSNRAASPVFRICFDNDTAITEGPYVVGFRLKPTAIKAVAHLFPGQNVASLRQLTPEEVALFVHHWETY